MFLWSTLSWMVHNGPPMGCLSQTIGYLRWFLPVPDGPLGFLLFEMYCVVKGGPGWSFMTFSGPVVRVPRSSEMVLGCSRWFTGVREIPMCPGWWEGVQDGRMWSNTAFGDLWWAGYLGSEVICGGSWWFEMVRWSL